MYSTYIKIIEVFFRLYEKLTCLIVSDYVVKSLNEIVICILNDIKFDAITESYTIIITYYDCFFK